MIEALDMSRFIRSAIRDVAVDLAWGAAARRRWSCCSSCATPARR